LDLQALEDRIRRRRFAEKALGELAKLFFWLAVLWAIVVLDKHHLIP
jgi:hypothetical protein